MGALLLAVAAWLIAVRYRTGRWTYKPGARITGPPERRNSDKGRALPSSSLEDGSGLIGVGAPDSSGTAGELCCRERVVASRMRQSCVSMTAATRAGPNPAAALTMAPR